jgi:tRNA modification GTPase
VVVRLKQFEPIPLVEIHSHGGYEVVRYLQEHFESVGIARVSWQDMTRRIETDPWRAAALIELAHAPTVRTASILLDQVNGAFTQALASIRSTIDKRDYQQAQQQLIDLAERASLGRHLTKPWRVVLAGAPNVGKSSLANRLAGYIRSVVAPTPGTTRDVVTTQLALDGWPVEIADTAGIREDGETLEGQGVELARSTVSQADLGLWLLDASMEPVWPDFESSKLHLVINKMDLANAWDLSQAGTAGRVSAETGEGVADLGSQIAHWLVPEPPPLGDAVPFTDAICERVHELCRSLAAGEFEDFGKKIDDFWTD